MLTPFQSFFTASGRTFHLNFFPFRLVNSVLIRLGYPPVPNRLQSNWKCSQSETSSNSKLWNFICSKCIWFFAFELHKEEIWIVPNRFMGTNFRALNRSLSHFGSLEFRAVQKKTKAVLLSDQSGTRKGRVYCTRRRRGKKSLRMRGIGDRKPFPSSQ